MPPMATPTPNDPTASALLAFWGAIRLSLARLGRTTSMLAVIFMALLPLLIVVLIAAATWHEPIFHQPAAAQRVYQTILRLVGLHFVAFFIAYILGQAVVRQDLEDETLHYLFLQPMPRWRLFVARFVAFFLLAGAAVVLGMWLCWLAATVPWMRPADLFDLLREQGRLAGLLREAGVLLLAVLFYGAAMIAVGSFFRSPFFAGLLLGWEAGVYYLPRALKYWTGSHYFHSLLPDGGAERRLFELIGEPAGVGLCLTLIPAASMVLLAIGAAAFHLRECQYGKTN